VESLQHVEHRSVVIVEQSPGDMNPKTGAPTVVNVPRVQLDPLQSAPTAREPRRRGSPSFNDAAVA
jgi:hypothetical protein